MKTRQKASAPAKVILFGEHFVVYGNPALLAAINKRTTADATLTGDLGKVSISSDIGISAEYLRAGHKPAKRITKTAAELDPIFRAAASVLASHPGSKSSGLHIGLTSEVPYGVGLGSSASSCVATVASVDSLFGAHSKSWICQKAILAERLIHKNSSGADCYVSTFGGLIRYSKRDGYARVKAKKQLSLVVCSTGLRHSTGELVEDVRKFRKAHLARFSGLAARASQIYADAVVGIESGKIDEVGRLMTENQRLLEEIGVSHRVTEKVIDLTLRFGALGAKISGAGGGGAVIGLSASKEESTEIAARLEKEGYHSMVVEIDRKGLVYE